MKNVHVAIVSWAGQHDNAAAIARAVTVVNESVTIVYSDPDPAWSLSADCEVQRRPNDLYWGDKFSACLRSNKADKLLIIHADTQCDDWAGLVSRYDACTDAHPDIGVWAPLIDHTPWHISNTAIGELTGSPLTFVAQTDAIVVGLSRSIQSRLAAVDLTRNVYGWGIDLLAVAHAYTTGQWVVVDNLVSIRHKAGCGYDQSAASEQSNEFMNQFSIAEQVQHRLLMDHCSQLRQAQSQPA